MKKKEFSVAGAREHGQCFIITLLHMNRLNKTESADLRFFDVFLLPGDLLSELFFYLHCSWFCAVWRPLNVSHHIIIVQILCSGSLGSLDSFWVSLKIKEISVAGARGVSSVSSLP